MKLAELIKSHEQAESNIGLSHAFGDTFLCSNNRIFRNIRKKTLEFDFTFSNEISIDYLVLSLAQLENILHSKKIPYFDNVSTLLKLEEKYPNITYFENVVDNYRFNFHFHESCHAVCRNLIQLQDFKISDPVLQRIVEESFANTCELLGVLDANSETHQIFWLINSYSSVFEVRELIEELSKILTMSEIFSITLYGYIHSNYLNEQISNPLFERITNLVFKNKPELIKNKKQILNLSKQLIENCFSLDETFKYISTGYYMKLNFPNLNHLNLNKQDWLSEFEKDEKLQNLIQELSRLAP